eukprot:CAMPEP_0194027316 /NCGR_PEP_ID=MMETSP0009_2-20130614/1483_1 /TAXON_ID=210454 /ORGANISM="Grammatophora oceanica, Strain CCMP 410" /LENGTH=331 /DNA_ID=CAMNT_0038666343 /DNA_START=74 /DNA_END=1069 /DNA_ORIENTATION=+
MAPIVLFKALKRQRCDDPIGNSTSSSGRDLDMRRPALSLLTTSNRVAVDSSPSSFSSGVPPPMKRRRRQAPHQQPGPLTQSKKSESSTKSLESLPPEVFCNVLSFVGPTSMSLLSLSGTNKYLHKTMKAIGDSMLPRALSHFRIPLKSLHVRESPLSYFLRHARTCSDVLKDVQHLRQLLARNPNHLSSSEVDNAMKMTLDLLDVAPALSVALERQILSTCGKCGGKVFKHSKSMLFHTLAGAAFPSTTTLTERLREQQEAYAKNQERLDMSRLIMQTVVFRELQLARTHPTGASGPVLAALSDQQQQQQRRAPLAAKDVPTSAAIGLAYF